MLVGLADVQISFQDRVEDWFDICLLLIDEVELSHRFVLPQEVGLSCVTSAFVSVSGCINPSVICHSTPPE